jgi:heme A synthase
VEFVPDLSNEVTALHWLHRFLAALAGVVVIGVSLRVMRHKLQMPVASKLAHAAAGLYVVELLVGAANVWTQSNAALNATLVAIHLALGALVWAALVGVAVVAHPAVRRLEGEVVHLGRPALEGGSP